MLPSIYDKFVIVLIIIHIKIAIIQSLFYYYINNNLNNKTSIFN